MRSSHALFFLGLVAPAARADSEPPQNAAAWIEFYNSPAVQKLDAAMVKANMSDVFEVCPPISPELVRYSH